MQYVKTLAAALAVALAAALLPGAKALAVDPAAAELAAILADRPAASHWDTVLSQVGATDLGAGQGASDGLDAAVIAVGRGGQMTSIESWYQTVDGVRKSPTQQAVGDLVNMYYGSYWVFYDDGALVIYHDTTYMRGDLTPTYGTYAVRNGRISFNTERTSRGTNSTNWLAVEGSIGTDAHGSLAAEVVHEINVLQSACVMGTCYNQRHFKSIEFTLPIR